MRVIYTSKGMWKKFGCALSIEKYGDMDWKLLCPVLQVAHKENVGIFF
jgi:hypothetical protein